MNGVGNHKVTLYVTPLHGSGRQKLQKTMLVSLRQRARLPLVDERFE